MVSTFLGAKLVEEIRIDFGNNISSILAARLALGNRHSWHTFDSSSQSSESQIFRGAPVEISLPSLFFTIFPGGRLDTSNIYLIYL